MKNTPSLLLLAALCLGLPACLENEEKIEVRADGSVRVAVRAHGHLDDFADGYPIPLATPWRAGSRDTERWLQEVGADTGSAEVRARLDEVDWPVGTGDEQEGPKATLAVVREFSAVGEWPRWFAPDTEPYRTAYMERSAKLEIKRHAERTVYVFERTYHGLDRSRLDPLERIKERIGEELDRFEEPDPYTDAEWEHIASVVSETYADVAESFARDAVLGVYTKGDASLSPTVLPGIVAAVRASAAELVTLDTLLTLHRALLQEDEETTRQILADLEHGHRDRIRDSLASSLHDAEVTDTTVNAVLFSLEWGFTAFDHYTDLADEDFEVTLTLPGTIVDGNYGRVQGDTAVWKFEGHELHSGDIVMRATSVLETDGGRRERDESR